MAADARSKKMLEDARRIAASNSTILIEGETGSGKDLLATVIHYLSPRAHEPQVKIDCAGLPTSLLESELFGYERGAFTGASQIKRGRMEMAGRGTLVLDQIAALPHDAQSKLLRVIEEKSLQRLGGARQIEVQARIIALSELDLEQAVGHGSFRADLYYRLNVLSLHVPPLRERRADIRPLIAGFLPRLAAAHGTPTPMVAPAALAALEEYDFPGNIRELRNLLERAIWSATLQPVRPATLTLDDLPANLRKSAQGPHRRPTLEQMERDYIAEVLDTARGRKGRAAEILGISRKTLLEKRKRYKLD